MLYNSGVQFYFQPLMHITNNWIFILITIITHNYTKYNCMTNVFNIKILRVNSLNLKYLIIELLFYTLNLFT